MGFNVSKAGYAAMESLAMRGLSPASCIWYVQYQGRDGQFVFAEDCAEALQAADCALGITSRPRIQSVKRVSHV